MSTLNESIAILEAMIEHEKTISLLYEVYAEKFQEHNAFWRNLSKEEEEHASWIKQLQKGVEDGYAQFVVDRFPLATINYSISDIKQQIDESKKPDFQLINALSVAVDIERALIENNYFKVLAGDSDLMKSTLTLLAISTQEHLQTVRKMLNDNRQAI